MANQQNQGQQLQIDLPKEVADGVYSNLVMIAHSPSEFAFDFINMLPGKPKANVVSRVVLTPENAKRLLFALQDNVKKYEQHFGTIQERQQTGLTFNMPAADA
jgi:hypothetical protein